MYQSGIITPIHKDNRNIIAKLTVLFLSVMLFHSVILHKYNYLRIVTVIQAQNFKNYEGKYGRIYYRTKTEYLLFIEEILHK